MEALEAWPGPDNVVLRQRLEAATQHHQEMAAKLQPYRAARLPVPDGWERALYDAERAVTVAQKAWDAGRARLDKLGEALREATEKAYHALAGALAHAEDRLGQACARIVHENDPEFLLSFPGRAPDELLPIHARTERVSGIMEALGTDVRVGMARFMRACGEVGREIVGAKADLGRSYTPERGPGRDSDRIMELTF